MCIDEVNRMLRWRLSDEERTNENTSDDLLTDEERSQLDENFLRVHVQLDEFGCERNLVLLGEEQNDRRVLHDSRWNRRRFHQVSREDIHRRIRVERRGFTKKGLNRIGNLLVRTTTIASLKIG